MSHRFEERPRHGAVIQRERMRAAPGERRHPVLVHGGGPTGAPLPVAVTPILDDDDIAGIEIRCSCGQHSYVEFEREERSEPRA
jgi:hypothetical protein